MAKPLCTLLFFLLLTSCTDSVLNVGKKVDEPTDSSLSKTSLLTGSYTDAFSVNRPYEMFKVEYGDSSPTFIQWIPNSTATSAGAVLIFLPYEGISWTGLNIDSTWVAKGAGTQADVDGPYYNASASSTIFFSPITPAQSAAEGVPYSYNGLHVAVVFGRYYSGGDVQNDIDDVKNGMRFLHSQNLVDKSKIGLYSGSWGGMGVLHAVAQLGESYKPKAISVIYPVSDAKKLHSYVNTTVPTATSTQATIDAYTTFFDPYIRRINKATESLLGSTSRYDEFSHSKLSSITSNIFVAHDDWDTLVPAGHTQDLLTTIGSTKKITYFHRHGTTVNFDSFARDHTQATETMAREGVMSWNYTFLINELTSSAQTRYSIYNSTKTVAQFSHTLTRKNAGSNTAFYNKVLEQLCEPNLSFIDGDGIYSASGSDLLFTLMNNYYQGGWAANGPAACTKLTTNPPF